MRASELTGNAAYNHEALKIIFQTFDAAWSDVAGNFGENSLAIQAARLKLANIILGLAPNSRDDPVQIKNAALKILARNLRIGAR